MPLPLPLLLLRVQVRDRARERSGDMTTYTLCCIMVLNNQIHHPIYSLVGCCYAGWLADWLMAKDNEKETQQRYGWVDICWA